MAWTSPRTWVAAEKPPAATYNTHVRDNFKAIGDAWTAYGSGSSWTSSGTAPSLGNGTWNGKYMQAGKLVHFRIVLTMGSTTTYGTGTYLLALPVAAASDIGRLLITNGDARDDSAAGDFMIGGLITNSATTLSLRALPATAGIAMVVVSNTVPFTFANLDSITISGTYEAA